MVVKPYNLIIIRKMRVCILCGLFRCHNKANGSKITIGQGYRLFLNVAYSPI